ncbi:HAD-IC family P-type ATPase [Lachnobacterium bovis]|uniref:Cation-transporting ATPase E n=1 Tax=Lachnobacterium bovis TaxID=140626 RepID=A0A1H9RG42_9FIRM|nr:HAD-IC family P-type ATPase [Lachnobacterium bovis]SER71770.1 cation-transporting ATPase E [Lachnobacterium bovis]
MADIMETDKQFGENKKVIDRVYADPRTGLSASLVDKRIVAGKVNKTVEPYTKSLNDIIKSNVYTYFNFIFFVMTILLILVRGWSDLIFLPIIIANTSIGVAQELYSKKQLSKLKFTNKSKYIVIRDAKKNNIESKDLVLDDIVLFKKGDLIPADAIVVEGKLKVNESILTGESCHVDKVEGKMLLSGSWVIDGQAFAKIDKVGKDSNISKLIMEASKEKSSKKSEMTVALDKLIQTIGIIIIPVAIALFIQSFIYNKAPFDMAIKSMIAALIGMIPEGLYLLASVTMAIGSLRLAKDKVIIHDMKSIEELARADFLCVDKTGTITDNKIKVKGYTTLDDKISRATLSHMLGQFVYNSDEITEMTYALKSFFTERDYVEVGKKVNFTSKMKYSGMNLGGKNYVLGSAENVLRDNYEKYREEIERYSQKGLIVLVFAEYLGELVENEDLTEEAIPLGVVFLSNPIRKNAKETFAFFRENGTKIKVISGDNPITVSKIANKVGIEGADKFIDARKLVNQEDYKKAVKEYTVFGRTSEYQKKELIKALKGNKHSVAMVGDGINDVLALREADCSIAMVTEGKSPIAQISQLVITDGDFSKIPLVVKEGRRVVHNIEQTAILYVAKNIFSLLLAIFSLIFVYNYPLLPSQVTIISLFTIGIPTFLLTLEKNNKKIQKKFLSKVFMKAVPAALTNFFVVSGLAVFCREFNVEYRILSTSATILVAIIGFIVLYKVINPFKKKHLLMIILLAIGLLLMMILMNEVFAINKIDKKGVLIIVLFTFVAAELYSCLELLFDKVHKFVRNNTFLTKIRDNIKSFL